MNGDCELGSIMQVVISLFRIEAFILRSRIFYKMKIFKFIIIYNIVSKKNYLNAGKKNDARWGGENFPRFHRNKIGKIKHVRFLFLLVFKINNTQKCDCSTIVSCIFQR